MDTQFAEGDLVEYVGGFFGGMLKGLRGDLSQEPDGRPYPWRLVLTRESQATLRAADVAAGAGWVEQDRLDGWLVLEDEIRKVEA